MGWPLAIGGHLGLRGRKSRAPLLAKLKRNDFSWFVMLKFKEKTCGHGHAPSWIWRSKSSPNLKTTISVCHAVISGKRPSICTSGSSGI